LRNRLRSIPIRVHRRHYCSLGFLAPFLGKLRGCYAGECVPGGSKVREIETECFERGVLASADNRNQDYTIALAIVARGTLIWCNGVMVARTLRQQLHPFDHRKLGRTIKSR
jgi:hypothetical protein